MGFSSYVLAAASRSGPADNEPGVRFWERIALPYNHPGPPGIMSTATGPPGPFSNWRCCVYRYHLRTVDGKTKPIDVDALFSIWIRIVQGFTARSLTVFAMQTEATPLPSPHYVTKACWNQEYYPAWCPTIRTHFRDISVRLFLPHMPIDTYLTIFIILLSDIYLYLSAQFAPCSVCF
ncbi:hypothetical protein BGX38DRAFT_1258115 [Terfezia claveryi]|nr:hypothetical protein BGX38DRAFT_1258115 [Terfezia claveryi]